MQPWLKEIFCLVYFVGIQSFHQTSKWIKDVKEERGDDVLIMLVGNKVDVKDRKVKAD